MTEIQPINQQPRKERSLVGPAAIIAAGAIGAAFLFSNGGGKPATIENTGAVASPSASASLEIKATPTPSEAAGSASPSPEARGDQYSKEGHYEKGAFATVKKGDYVIGDAKMAVFGTPQTVDGIKQFVPAFDEDGRTEPGVTDTGKTGTFIHFDEDAEVYFPYGGDVIDGSQIQNQDIWVAQQVDSIVNGGCAHGCPQGVGINNQPIEWKGLDTMLAGEITARDYLAKNAATVNNSTANPDASQHPENCTCVVCCPVQTPAPTPTPVPTPTPNVCVTPVPSETPSCETDHQLKKGAFYKLPSGHFAIISADVIIDGHKDSKGNVVGGIKAADNLSGTRAVDELLDGKSHTIFLAYGDGNVIDFCQTAPMSEIQTKYNAIINDVNDRRPIDKNSVIIK